MERVTNDTQIPLSMALWLSVDEYDAVDEEGYLSATSFLKPTRQLVLSGRLTDKTTPIVDVAQLAQSRIGTAIHNSVEQSWTNPKLREMALTRLGYTAEIRNRIIVNGDPNNLPEGAIPVYLEQRICREFEGHLIGGKYDMVTDGILADIKSTTTWTYMHGSNNWKYRLQGSIYRWLNPEIITKDYMLILFVFLNWSPGDYAKGREKGYPPHRVMAHRVDLLSLQETELFIKDKLNTLDALKDADETELPLCTPDELWQDPSVWKYYKNPLKKLKSTKNFDSVHEADIRRKEDGCVGEVAEVRGLCKACKYCPAFILCSQKDELIKGGQLEL
jgi:hypothetical protein